ncbi:DUF5384 family protein [Pseudomonas sp. KNUC1026]|uniref:DUF5384 family protein n=1 Tax=Pseudomonas sp. KNUC1026 TaxID=2893890 RepID=UPI001F1C9653|nr:DUF5384 family protein [Pseudomonas sp. KNUC1026]UFH49206.1 DUF5384 family protein [Pseudomonas sp. KNUC1026]
MKSRYLGLALLLAASPALAGPFDQLQQIEVQQKQAEDARRAEQKRAYDAEVAQQRAQAQAAARKREAIAEQKRAEQKRLQNRDEKFVDEERAMALEERRLKLDAMKARTARTNDYIDAELREKAARSDVIQSEADANRNISTGAKSLMESTGDAEVNKSKSWFGS